MTMTNEQAMAALEYFAGETCSSFCVTWEHRHAPCDCGRAKKLLILRAYIEAAGKYKRDALVAER